MTVERSVQRPQEWDPSIRACVTQPLPAQRIGISLCQLLVRSHKCSSAGCEQVSWAPCVLAGGGNRYL